MAKNGADALVDGLDEAEAAMQDQRYAEYRHHETHHGDAQAQQTAKQQVAEQSGAQLRVTEQVAVEGQGALAKVDAVDDQGVGDPDQITQAEQEGEKPNPRGAFGDAEQEVTETRRPALAQQACGTLIAGDEYGCDEDEAAEQGKQQQSEVVPQQAPISDGADDDEQQAEATADAGGGAIVAPARGKPLPYRGGRGVRCGRHGVLSYQG